MNAFTVGVTDDLRPAGGVAALDDLGLRALKANSRVRWQFIPADRELTAPVADGCDAIILLRPNITKATLTGSERLCLLARWGVGYDRVDVKACTAAGVLLTITPDAVRRPMASSALAFVMALAHRVVDKDRAARAGDQGWQRRIDSLGTGLAGRVLGIVGLGNVGRELLTLARPLGMHHLAADPYVAPEAADAAGTRLVSLDELLATADFVCLTCALTPETHHLIDAERLAGMKPDAYLVNVARGAIVDQAALVRALRSGQIAGAGLDTLEREPPDPAEEILGLDNVILAPHSLGWTDQLTHATAAGVTGAILDLLGGRVPHHVVNPDVLHSPLLHRKLARHGIPPLQETPKTVLTQGGHSPGVREANIRPQR